MKDIDFVECPKCHTKNVKGSLKCAKCKSYIVPMKSCPRCAKVNDASNVKCSRCGFKFKRKRRPIWVNLVISLLLLVILCILVYLDKEGIVRNISKTVKILAVLLVVSIFIYTLNYGSKDVMKYSAEEEISANPKFEKMRKIANIAVIVGIIIAFVFICCYYFIG